MLIRVRLYKWCGSQVVQIVLFCGELQMHVYSVMLYMCLLLHTVYQCALYCDGVRSAGEFL